MEDATQALEGDETREGGEPAEGDVEAAPRGSEEVGLDVPETEEANNDGGVLQLPRPGEVSAAGMTAALEGTGGRDDPAPCSIFSGLSGTPQSGGADFLEEMADRLKGQGGDP
eukprot:6737800-Pyramimonas_sp.AAC.1